MARTGAWIALPSSALSLVAVLAARPGVAEYLLLLAVPSTPVAISFGLAGLILTRTHNGGGRRSAISGIAVGALAAILVALVAVEVARSEEAVPSYEYALTDVRCEFEGQPGATADDPASQLPMTLGTITNTSSRARGFELDAKFIDQLDRERRKGSVQTPRLGPGGSYAFRIEHPGPAASMYLPVKACDVEVQQGVRR